MVHERLAIRGPGLPAQPPAPTHPGKRHWASVAVLLCSMVVGSPLLAQDALFVSAAMNPLHLNPAFAGPVRPPHRIGLNTRQQWLGMEGLYRTYALTYDVSLRQTRMDFLDRVGAGVQIINDRSARTLMNDLSASLFLSYALNVTRNHVARFALKGTYRSRRIDWSRVVFPDQLEGNNGTWTTLGTNDPLQALEPTAGVDFGGGVVLQFVNYDGWVGAIGASVDHPHLGAAGTPTPVHPYIPTRWNIHANAEVDLYAQGTWKLLPLVLFARQQFNGSVGRDTHQELMAGSSVRFGFTTDQAVSLGVYWRMQNAWVWGFGYGTERIKALIMVDFPQVNGLERYRPFTSELALSFLLGKDPKNRKFRSIPCPTISPI